jgi:hypothetical protein
MGSRTTTPLTMGDPLTHENLAQHYQATRHLKGPVSIFGIDKCEYVPIDHPPTIPDSVVADEVTSPIINTIGPEANNLDAQLEIRLVNYKCIKDLIVSDIGDILLRYKHQLYVELVKLWSIRHPKEVIFSMSIQKGSVRDYWRSAREWLLKKIEWQAYITPEDDTMTMIREAIQKGPHAWDADERFYMTLTDPAESNALKRLKHALLLVLQHKYAVRFQETLGKLETEAFEVSLKAIGDSKTQWDLVTEEDVNQWGTLTRMLGRGELCYSDKVACPVRLSYFETHDVEKKCSVCLADFADITIDNEIEAVCNDYPVKLKGCGHIIGKNCLHEWLRVAYLAPDAYHGDNHRFNCPLCRRPVSFWSTTDIPIFMRKHIGHGIGSLKAQKWRMRVNQCQASIRALMNAEIILEELNRLVDHDIVCNSRVAAMDARKAFLKMHEDRVKDEKLMWGFGGQERLWKSSLNLWNGRITGEGQDR